MSLFIFSQKDHSPILNTDSIFFQQKHKNTVKNIINFLSQLWFFWLSIIFLYSNFIFSKIATTKTQLQTHFIFSFSIFLSQKHSKNNKTVIYLTKHKNNRLYDSRYKYKRREVRDEEETGPTTKILQERSVITIQKYKQELTNRSQEACILTTPETPTCDFLTWSSLHSTCSLTPEFPLSTTAPLMQTVLEFERNVFL